MSKRTAGILMLILLAFPAMGFAQGDWWESKIKAKQAWKAMDEKKYDEVYKVTDECIRAFEQTALKQESVLKEFPDSEGDTNWALNDVATCYFIKGLAYKEQKQIPAALDIFFYIIFNFPHAQCWDPFQNLYWKVALGAKDQIYGLAAGVDFGNSSPDYLTAKAQESLDKKDYEKALMYASRCILFNKQPAIESQKALTSFPQNTIQFVGLNKVGESILIKAKVYLEQGKKDLSKEALNEIIANFPYSQVWSKSGALHLSEEAGKLLKEIEGSPKAEKPAAPAPVQSSTIAIPPLMAPSEAPKEQAAPEAVPQPAAQQPAPEAIPAPAAQQ